MLCACPWDALVGKVPRPYGEWAAGTEQRSVAQTGARTSHLASFTCSFSFEAMGAQAAASAARTAGANCA